MIGETPDARELWLIVTPEQLNQGWMELRGVTPIHHNFIVLRKLDDGNYVVRNPHRSFQR